MAKKGKKRVSITVTADQFDRVSALLDQEGFPSGYLSFFLDRSIRDLEDRLTGRPTEYVSALEGVYWELREKRENEGKKV